MTKTPKIIIVVPHYWGKGDTITEAWKNVKKESYKNLRELKSGPHAIFLGFDTEDAKFQVNNMGSLMYPSDTEYFELDRKEM